MPVYLIEIENGANHPERDRIWQNVTEMGVETGDAIPFTRIGIVQHRGEAKHVRMRAEMGLTDRTSVSVRKIGPVTRTSDEDHVHWRLCAARLKWANLSAREREIIRQHSQGEFV
ncbi:hypothetical protein [Rhizobium ruizarguesonis]|uniref:hypothetical protein n=1 Tax=Rhizobium ruizarguesonis TaxID=2081791 RepID=UPI0013C104C9|nr:hypothetical protein [Rhizobium ruizarguesonis]NEJ00147.1 hypothetical protein [Rhizobium ruizarguesonis]NEJ37663.1 hypothetical protein [Rhizobium ruizarguesonis]